MIIRQEANKLLVRPNVTTGSSEKKVSVNPPDRRVSVHMSRFIKEMALTMKTVLSPWRILFYGNLFQKPF